MRHHQPTRDYVERRTAEGLSKREIIRCLKRYIAREIYANLPRPERQHDQPSNMPLDEHRSIERFHRTLAEGWAFKKFYNSESARLAALPAWVHEYNHHRPHSAIGKGSPITRLNNLAGHHI